MGSVFNMPPVAGVQDPQVRSLLQAIVNNFNTIEAQFARKGEVAAAETRITFSAQGVARQEVAGAAAKLPSLFKSMPADEIRALAKQVVESSVSRVLRNSGTDYVTMTRPVVFTTGWASTGVFIGAGGLFGFNTAGAPAGSAFSTFLLDAADGTFSVGYTGVTVDGAGGTSTAPVPAEYEGKFLTFNPATGDFIIGPNVRFVIADGLTVGEMVDAVNSMYSRQQLETDLANGVNGIVAGIANPDFRFGLLNTSAYFGHKDIVYNGVSQAAITAGKALPAILLNAQGIAMGVNRKDNGQWQNTVFIDATTGNASFAGTITADSILSVNAKYSSGQTLQEVIDTVAHAATLNDLQGKLDKKAEYVLGTEIALKTTGFASGSGIAITDNGIIAKKGGVYKFSLTNDGDAYFYGTISGAKIEGGSQIETSGYVSASGEAKTTGLLVSGTSALSSGFFTTSRSDGSSWFGGVIGYGAHGSGNSFGVAGITLSPSGFGVYGKAALGGKAIYCDGDFHITQTPTTGASAATFSATKPGAANTNKWIKLHTSDGDYWIPAWKD